MAHLSEIENRLSLENIGASLQSDDNEQNVYFIKLPFIYIQRILQIIKNKLKK